MIRLAALSIMLCLPPAALADAPTSQPDPTDQPLNEKLVAMADNTWLNLQPAGQDKVEARMYSGNCFGGGFLWYFGGAHRSYPGNDVDLFNPRTNTWTQATEPEMPDRNSPLWKSLTGGGGGSRGLTPLGRPYIEHTYQQVCWQPDRKRFFVVMLASGTWEFDPLACKWEFLTGDVSQAKAEPRGHWAHNQVVWDPTVEAPVLLVSSGGGGIYKYDHAKRAWQRIAALPGALNWKEFYMAWVPEWKAFAASTTKGVWGKLDAAKGKWEPFDAPEALKGCQALSYDAANEAVIALDRRKLGKRDRTVVPWALDVKTMKWQELAPAKPWPSGQSTGDWASFWYDPDHNVHYLVNDVRRDRQATFDGGVTETWAYRYRKTAPVDAPTGSDGQQRRSQP